MKFLITAIIALFLFTGCVDKEFEDSEIFIGSYRIMDQMVAYPYLFQQNKDSTFFFDNTGQLIDKIRSKGLEEIEEFKFKENHIKILRITETGFLGYDSMDTLNFKPLKSGGISFKDVAIFKRISFAKRLDIQKVKETIVNSVWKYDVVQDENSNPNEDLALEQVFHFKKDSVTVLTDYYYQGLKTVSEYETKAYSIFEIDHHYFLSFQKENDNPQPIYQILEYDSKKIELKDFSSREIKNIKFYKNPISPQDFKNEIEKTSEYSNCFDGYQGEYYFGEDVTFKKGNSYIVDYVNKDAPQNDSGSGYIIIHFTINCRSDLGKFGLIQMNRDFKNTAFSKEMINHLLNKVRDLKDFPSTYSNLEWLNYKDVHGFLMFRLEQGKIVDLCP